MTSYRSNGVIWPCVGECFELVGDQTHRFVSHVVAHVHTHTPSIHVEVTFAIMIIQVHAIGSCDSKSRLMSRRCIYLQHEGGCGTVYTAAHSFIHALGNHLSQPNPIGRHPPSKDSMLLVRFGHFFIGPVSCVVCEHLLDIDMGESCTRVNMQPSAGITIV